MKATFGAGCFWHVEDLLSKTKGVTSTAVGYIGGELENPTYEQVCTDQTGHAEAVEVEFNPDEISYQELLDVFWKNHNPTTLNRQGNDIGPQYRSVIFYKNDEELTDIEEVIGYLQQNFVDDIVTEVSPLINFFVAENIHHNYFANNPNNPYCSMVVGPKISKTRAKHASLYK